MVRKTKLAVAAVAVVSLAASVLAIPVSAQTAHETVAGVECSARANKPTKSGNRVKYSAYLWCTYNGHPTRASYNGLLRVLVNTGTASNPNWDQIGRSAFHAKDRTVSIPGLTVSASKACDSSQRRQFMVKVTGSGRQVGLRPWRVDGFNDSGPVAPLNC